MYVCSTMYYLLINEVNCRATGLLTAIRCTAGYASTLFLVSLEANEGYVNDYVQNRRLWPKRHHTYISHILRTISVHICIRVVRPNPTHGLGWVGSPCLGQMGRAPSQFLHHARFTDLIEITYGACGIVKYKATKIYINSKYVN